ncbi:DNA repair protein RecN [Nesterenkonia sphaerica]|uniref:DNA repair protein RecN n=1 Tax=Nesterenkonia sphaerica TaxID=1804988 RepID=A0A5R8ZZL1_9MICC|nr:DNA repair protein RecN [Nesterenkonia sphaerica]TLP71871.1 DNA repair protein RecN [Nesterenkonia sphaerica]
MIEHVSISDLGVIERAEWDLAPGFNVVTGETGAGKTMVVTAFSLLLGARADAATVRTGADKAAVDAEISVTADHPAHTTAQEAGVLMEELDETEGSTPGAAEPLLLGRAVSAKGRSRATLAGRAVPVSLLGAVGSELVTLHGQSDQLRLKTAAAQRAALDSYAGQAGAQLLAQYGEAFAAFQRQQAELEEITAHELERRREAEQLQRALEAIDELDPQPGEDEQLKAESMRLDNIESLRNAARSAQAALSGGDAAEVELGPHAAELLDRATQALSTVTDQDSDLAEISRQISEVSSLLTDAASQLGLYAADLDEAGPERVAEVHARRAEIDKLLRLYGPEVTDVLAWAEDSRKRLATLHSDSERIDELTETVAQLHAQLWQQAQQLREIRSEAAERLSAAVGSELGALAMPQAHLVIEVTPTEQLTKHGADTVSFLLQPHPGTEPLPLGKGASGGELSRVMLALEVVLAEQQNARTFIFDEVDAGVGGKAAVQIGERLAALARHAQVIVVTHLPQVAAYADHHIRVHKTAADGGGVTASDVRTLQHSERVAELARMLAGQEDSSSARAHAAELLETAGQAAST